MQKEHQTEYIITYAELFLKVHFLYTHGQQKLKQFATKVLSNQHYLICNINGYFGKIYYKMKYYQKVQCLMSKENITQNQSLQYS